MSPHNILVFLEGGEVENSIWMNPDAEHIFGRLMMTFDVVISTQDMCEHCGGELQHH